MIWLDGQNPRVAVTLNLLTAGFGYFYLGERSKGIVLFVVMQVARMANTKLAVLVGLVQLIAAADAYRIAHRQVTESLAMAGQAPLQNVSASRLPVQVPVALACLLVAGALVLAVIGLTLGSSAKRQAVVSATN